MEKTCTIDGQIYFTNLPALVVGGFKPAAGPGDGWIPFNVGLDNFSSVGLATGAYSTAGELILDLGLKGWHRLHVGHNPAIRIWLEGETGYCELPGDPSAVRDIPLPVADFTGRRLHIAAVRGAEKSQEVKLFYLRAEPCEGPTVNHRNLIATDDGHGVFWRGMDAPRDIYRHVYPYRDSDFFRMVWGVYGGAILSMRRDSKAAESPIRPDDTHLVPGERAFCRSLQRLQASGADPLALVRQATREYGLELHYYIRMSAFYGPFPHQNWTTHFFKDNPQWRCRDEFGQTVNFMSYAYPQVQERMLAYFDELLDYEPEGICLALNRGLPLMICEEPVLEAYRRKYGRTPKLPEEVDTPELLVVRQELLAGFVERASSLAEKRGKVISCIVPRDFEHNRLFGLDVNLLVKRGLVESVMVGAGHGDNPVLNSDLEPVRALKVLGSGTKVYGGGSNAVHGMAWVNGDLKARARQMASVLDAGLYGVWFWDAEQVIGYEWEAMRHFGDRKMLDRIVWGEWPIKSTHKTLSIHDLVVGRYNPWHAY
ncbi:MAG: hypothetical protein WCP55_00650 [Lentisphaerota bacterium]